MIENEQNKHFKAKFNLKRQRIGNFDKKIDNLIEIAYGGFFPAQNVALCYSFIQRRAALKQHFCQK